MFPVEAILFVMLIITAFAVVRQTNLFAAAMLTGLFSLLSAGLFTLMDAVDVAFTEASVGAGISTILILGTLALTAKEENQQPFRLLPLVVVLITGGALLIGTVDMPAYGDFGAVTNHRIAPDYIAGTASEFEHIPNVVTTVLGSYRGYDTLGETGVIFTASLGVMALLGGRRRRRPADGAPDDSMDDTTGDPADDAAEDSSEDPVTGGPEDAA